MSLHATKSDKGKGKMSEYEVEVHLDDKDSDESARSLDSEFNVPIMRTPGVKKTLTSANEKLCHSSRVKNPITQNTYTEYMAHHYAFTMKVAAEQDTEIPNRRHSLERKESNYHEPCKVAESRAKAESRETAESHAKDKPRKAAKRAELPHKGRRKPKATRTPMRPVRTLDASHLSLRGRVEISSSTKFRYYI